MAEGPVVKLLDHLVAFTSGDFSIRLPRNIFALTSVLEDHEMVVLAAEIGTAAIDLLANPSLVESC